MHEMPDRPSPPRAPDGPRFIEAPDPLARLREPTTTADTRETAAVPTPPAPEAGTVASLWRSAGRRAVLRERRIGSLRRRVAWSFALLAVLTLVALGGPNKADLYAAASSARASWRYDRALAFYQQAVEADPADPRPHCLMGEVLALQQRSTQATAAFEQCRRLGDDGPTVWLALGDLARDRGDLSGAEQAWRDSAARGGIQARRRLGLHYEAQSRFDEAEVQWSSLGTADGQAQEHLGMLALRRADFTAAQHHFVAAREAPGFFGQEAVDAGLVQLSALGSTTPEAQTAIGVAFVQDDLPAFARLPLQRALAQAPDDAPAHAYLAWVEWLAGARDASATDLQAARQLNPVDSFMLFVAAEQELAGGQWSAADDDIALALQGDDKNPVLWLVQAQVALGTQKYLTAELSYETAARLAPEPVYTEQLLQFYLDHRLGTADGRARVAGVTAVARWPSDAT
ncbi:MAG TPA: hypothetical protein VF916_08510, partial [Ktedonobacterales bacterium]